jgi:hypothetical protein
MQNINKPAQINKMIPKLNQSTCYRIIKYILDNKVKYSKNNEYFLINLANCTEKQIDVIYNIIFIDNYEPLKQNTMPKKHKNTRDLSWLDKIAI